jgi:uncharacterized protein YjiS (DUF1127 family)
MTIGSITSTDCGAPGFDRYLLPRFHARDWRLNTECSHHKKVLRLGTARRPDTDLSRASQGRLKKKTLCPKSLRLQRITTMSLLDGISDFSSAPMAIQRSIKAFARGVFRVINNAVAAFIAYREYQANLAILRSLTDRELRDMGLERGQIGIGLATAANERTLRQSRRLMGRP